MLKHENVSLKKELENATEEISLKSLKKCSVERGIRKNNNIIDDNLTIVRIGNKIKINIFYF